MNVRRHDVNHMALGLVKFLPQNEPFKDSVLRLWSNGIAEKLYSDREGLVGKVVKRGK